jgi:hypothetical protein
MYADESTINYTYDAGNRDLTGVLLASMRRVERSLVIPFPSRDQGNRSRPPK